MGEPSLQFQAAASPAVLVALLGAIALILLAAAAGQFARRQWRRGAVLLCAAAGPAALLPTVVVEIVRQQRARNRPAVVLLGASAVVLAAGVAAAAALAGRSAEAAWMILLAGQAAGAMGVFYAGAYARLGAGRLAGLTAMRIAAVVALMLAMFKPAIRATVDPLSLRPPLAVLIDRSGSMATAAEDGAPPRLSQAVAALVANKQRLESVFKPTWTTFAASPDPPASLEAIAGLRASGPGSDGTDIASAIGATAGAGERPAAVLLLSDGIHNAAGDAAQAAAQAGAPIYVAGVGSAERLPPGQRNIAIASVDAPLAVASETIASVRAAVQIDQLVDVPLTLRLLDEDTGKVLDSATLSAAGPSEVLTAELKWTAQAPADAGRVRRLAVAAAPNPAEAISEDNSAPLHVLVTDPRIGVLYVEGSIRPEYKYLRRLLDGDPQIQLASLVRVSGGEFWSQGAIGGRRITALPARDDDFRGLDVIIIGDLDSSFLSAAAMSAIRRFVAGGGALLMLGGHSSFGPGGYGGSDIEAILPVTVGGRDQPQETDAFLPHLTAAGAAHPAMAGMDEFLPSPGNVPAAAESLPKLAGCVAVVGAKPGASVLAVHPTRSNQAGPLVVLAVQQVGGGRTAAFTADTTWRWRLPMQAAGAAGPYQKFWRQLIRYLAAAEAQTQRAEPAVLLRVDRAYVRLGQACKVTVWADDGDAAPIDPSRLRCTITPAGGEAQLLSLSGGSGATLTATAKPNEAGQHVIKAWAVDADGETIAADELAIFAAGPSGEADRLAPDWTVLRAVAARSGGQAVELADLGRLIEQMVSRHGLATQAAPAGRTYRLYHFPLLFAAFVVLVSVEWLLRRRWQLH